MNENKVPCGGFRIGDGLTMEGNTLKSLGGAYIKIANDEEHPETYKIADDSPLNYETAMKYDGLIFMLVQQNGAQIVVPLFNKIADDLIFNFYTISDSLLIFVTINVYKDNSIVMTSKQYTLTPAT